MAKRGTRVNIDLDELAKLCALQCTDEELAAWFKVTTRTIRAPPSGAGIRRYYGARESHGTHFR